MAIAMLAVCLIPLAGSDSSAAVGDGETYTYTLTYDSSQMSVDWATSTALSMAGMNAIYHPSYDSSTGTTTGYGDWTWSSTTGLGPFNSFYGAFDMTDGNKFVAILDPFDLTHGIDGTDYTSQLADLNIMWVLPTVYWKTDATHVYLTNDPGADTDYVAYAHTIDGHTYNYIAIGVYEGSTKTVGGQTVLTSQSGATPSASMTRAVFRTAAHAYGQNGELNASLATDPSNPAYGMLWNFYQWELYKLCSYTLMENFNSQNTVGNGHVYGSTYAFATGATNTMGPYAGNPGIITDNTTGTSYGSDPVKLFIENAWGGVSEFVDGVVVNSNQGFYIDTRSTPDDSTTAGGQVVYKTASLPASNFGSAIFTDSEIWGFASATSGTALTGTTDRIYTATSGSKVLAVGGNSNTNASNSVHYGLSFAGAGDGLTISYASLGSRLAFVFDAGPASSATVTVATNDAAYGGVDVSTVQDVPLDTAVSINGSVLTIATTPATVITATPSADTPEYDYSFVSWTIGGQAIPTNYTITGDVTITANFSRAVQEYTATIESNNTAWGTVSTGTVPNIPYGTVLHLGADDSLIIGSVSDPIATITVSPAAQTVRYTYAFTGYDVQDGDVITADQTIVATFSQTERTYTVSVLTNDQTRGTVYPVVILNVPGETYFQVNGNTITLDTQSSTATVASPTAQYTYAFDGWYSAASGGSAITNSTQVLGDMDVYAVFSATANTYTVTASVSPSGYGSVDVPSLQNVPYGTLITVSGNVATVGSTDVTATIAPATAQYTYAFSKWQYNGQDIGASATVQANGALTAVFTRTVNTYTITWDVDGTTTQEIYSYGDTPSTAAPTKPNYTFNGWNPSIHSVTGDQTYTATWYATTYTITWDPAEGAFPNQPSHTVTTTGTVETPAPLPSTDPVYAHYDFAGWFTAIDGGDEIVTPYYPIANATWYAHWDAVVYTVTFDANGGQGTPEPLDGSADAPILLPATVPTVPNTHFSGWYTAAEDGEYVGTAGSYYIPTADITLYAHFSENVDYSFSLYLNPNTGYGGPGVMNATTQTDIPYEFTIPSKEPVKYLMTFDGWATTPDATESEYSAGDTVSVDPNSRLTLYAVWTEGEGHDDFSAILGAIPILAGVGIVLGAVGMLYSKSRRTELTTKDFVTTTLGIAISVIVLALVMVPIIGGL